MATTFKNDSATPIGLWDADKVHHIVPPYGGNVTIDPSPVAQDTIGVLVASGAGSAVDVEAPVNTVEPAVTGDAIEGETLTVSNGTWTGTPAPTYSRVWQRSADGSTGWANISGATATTRVLAEEDVGQYLRAVVTGTNSAGNATATSNVVGPIEAAE